MSFNVHSNNFLITYPGVWTMIRKNVLHSSPMNLTLANTLVSKPSTSLSLMLFFGWSNSQNLKHHCCRSHKLVEHNKPDWLEATQIPHLCQKALQAIWQNRTVKAYIYLYSQKAKCKLTYDLCCLPSFYPYSSCCASSPPSSYSTLTQETSHLRSSENWICLLQVSYKWNG